MFFFILQFTFASNAATLIGGSLVTNAYKLRLPAAFLSAFFISVSYPLKRVGKFYLKLRRDSECMA